jgi:hypothetical protein
MGQQKVGGVRSRWGSEQGNLGGCACQREKGGGAGGLGALVDMPLLLLRISDCLALLQSNLGLDIILEARCIMLCLHFPVIRHTMKLF